MDYIKNFIDYISAPTISFTLSSDFVISTYEEDDKNHLFISGNNHSAWPE
mgnify:CR=1 FL=1